MDKETANLALQFMNRVQLQGNEVPAWLQVVRALKKEAGDESAADEGQSEPNN